MLRDELLTTVHTMEVCRLEATDDLVGVVVIVVVVVVVGVSL